MPYGLENLKNEILDILKSSLSNFVEGEITNPDNLEFLKEVSLDIAQLKWELLTAETEIEKQIKRDSIEAYYDVIELKLLQKRIKVRSEFHNIVVEIIKTVLRSVTKLTLGTIGI